MFNLLFAGEGVRPSLDQGRAQVLSSISQDDHAFPHDLNSSGTSLSSSLCSDQKPVLSELEIGDHELDVNDRDLLSRRVSRVDIVDILENQEEKKGDAPHQ